MLKRILLFFVLNATALSIGSLYTKTAVAGEWYTSLNKAPWTPPGYMFGIMWSIIMMCFAIYMAYVIPKVDLKKVIILYTIQWI